MPAGAGRQANFEAEPAVGKHGRRIATLSRNGRGTCEVGVSIGIAQRLRHILPLCGNASATDYSTGLDVKDIRKVRAKSDFEVKSDRFLAEIGDVQVLMHALVDDAR